MSAHRTPRPAAQLLLGSGGARRESAHRVPRPAVRLLRECGDAYWLAA
ncbi:hypothetical protein [Actinocorallia populi]|nr:hypothetical protein [Actinocorallia populi]